MTPSGFNLDRLIYPVSVAAFREEYWERCPLVIQRDDPSYFAHLLTLQDVERIVRMVEPGTDAMRVVMNGVTLDLGETTLGSEDVFSAYRSGGTIVLHAVDRRCEPLMHLANDLSREFSHGFQINAYLTPSTGADSRGLSTHYDTHDVFVLQIAGVKHWRLFDSPIRLPLRDQPFVSGKTRLGEVMDEIDLRPGDCIYIPRGHVHDASVTGTAASLHLTVGVHSIKWVDLLRVILSDAVKSDGRLRESLPIGFANDQACVETLKEQFHRMVALLVDEQQFEVAMGRVIMRAIHQQRPVLSGHLSDLDGVAELSLHTRVQRRREIASRITIAEGSVCLHFHGKLLDMPEFAESSLRFILEARTFSASELPDDLDAAGKITLVRRLLKEGFLTLHRTKSNYAESGGVG